MALSHAVFNPSFNALATAMSDGASPRSQVLEIARDRHVRAGAERDARKA
jgi:membrane glycosyltransferase